MDGSPPPRKLEYHTRDRARVWQSIKPLPVKKDLEGRVVDLGEVRKVLGSKGADFEATATMLREHAVRVQVSREERGRAAEARATTLLGTVPIAASLVIAGSGLVLDKITGGRRVAIMGLICLLLIVLLTCAYVASRAVLKSRIQVTNEPRMRQALNWAANTDAKEVEVKRVTDLVDRADQTLYVAEYKRAQLTTAYDWYRAALVLFGLLGLALFANVACP